MNRIMLLTIVILSFTACKKDGNKLSANRLKVENKEWFKNLQEPCNANEICKTYVNVGIYKGGTVYYSGMGGALCDTNFFIALLDANGEIVKEYGETSDDMKSFYKEVTFIETIYRCDE